jgi:hypothetical protein
MSCQLNSEISETTTLGPDLPDQRVAAYGPADTPVGAQWNTLKDPQFLEFTRCCHFKHFLHLVYADLRGDLL